MPRTSRERHLQQEFPAGLRSRIQKRTLLSGSPAKWCNNSRSVDKSIGALQYYSMTAIPVSKRGTITLPPEIRRALGLEAAENPMMLVEMRGGGVFLLPAEAMPVRDIPLETMQQWIAEDERDSESFWQKAGKA